MSVQGNAPASLDARIRSELEHKASMYDQLARIYPKEQYFLKRQAEILLQLGHELLADKVLGRLRRLAEKSGQAGQVRELDRLRREISDSSPESNTRLTPVFHLTDDEAMKMLFTRARRRSLEEGEYLIRQGESGEALYVVIDGELAVMAHYKNMPDPVLVNILREGEIVGEIAFLRGSARCADVLASRETALVELSRKHVLKCLLGFPEVEAALAAESAVRERIVAISGNPLLAALPLRLRRHMAESSRIHHYSPLEVICRAGDSAGDLGVLDSGLVRAVAEDCRGSSHLLEPVKPGGLIHDVAIIHKEPVVADLVAVKSSRIVYIPLPVLKEAMQIHPPLYQNLMREASRRIADTMTLISRKSGPGS